MKLSEAYAILGIPESSSNDEVKQAFRKLAAKLHPDNKETGSETEFKKINDAWITIENPHKATPEFRAPQNRSNARDYDFDAAFRDAFGNKKHWKTWTVSPSRDPSFVYQQTIYGETTITFAESAIGCSKDISITRNTPCDGCSSNTYTGCIKCKGKRVLSISSVYKVNIPAGVMDGQLIKLAGLGHYVPIFKSYDDAFIRVKVTPDPEMTVEGSDIVSILALTLLEALKGTVKKVRTVKGEMTLKIRPGVRNGDKINAKNYGVGGIGSHIFILNISYPEDLSKLIKALEDNTDQIKDVQNGI
jgi:DnaJ-class molecular chaperone